MNIQVVDWAAHYKAVKSRMAGAQPARIRLGVRKYEAPIGPPTRDWLRLHEVAESLKSRFDRIRDEELAAAGVTLEQFNGQQRGSKFTQVRRLVWWRAYKETTLSLPRIGQLSGGKDHTTVLSAIRRYEELKFGIPCERLRKNRERALERHRAKYVPKKRRTVEA